MKKILFALLFAAPLLAQVSVVPYRNARATFTDANGLPLAGGCIFTYQGGTSTPQATYTDYTGGTPNSNPVILDSTGSAVIWLGPNAYKFVAFSAGGTNCATGAQQWSVDQVPGNSFAGSISGAAISGGTISGAAISGGSINTTPIGATTPNPGDFTNLLTASVNRTLYPAQCITNTNYASWCISGGDIGQQINGALASCSDECTVHLTPGSYSYAATISASTGSPSLVCDSGTTLTYTGPGDGIDFFNLTLKGQPLISGCAFAGTSNGEIGLHLKGSSLQGVITGVSISGFTSGDCIRNEGLQEMLFLNVNLSSCQNGVHSTGQSGGAATSFNRFIGGQISDMSQYGVYEDAAQRVSVGYNAKEAYVGMIFTSNAIQAFFQGCVSCELGRDALFVSSGTIPEQVLLGDGSNNASATLIEGNYFWVNGATVTDEINLVNSTAAIIKDNYEISSPAATNFINAGSSSTGAVVGPNITTATNYDAGTGTYAQLCNGAAQCTALLTSFQAVGTPAGVSGCSATGALGGSQAGQFTVGATGSCSVTITPGYTANNGWICHMNDFTGSGVPIVQTGSTTTTATFTGTPNAGDKMTWECIAF